MRRVAALGIALGATSQHALAQQPIGGGGVIQQIPPAPTLEKPVPELPIPRQQTPAAPVPGGARFPVKSLHITGQTEDGLVVHSLCSLLADLATLARNTITTAIASLYPLTVLTRPTPIQRKAFDLLATECAR